MGPLINMDGVGGFVCVSVCWHSVYACVFAWCVCVFTWVCGVCMCVPCHHLSVFTFSVLEKSDMRCKYKAKLSSGILPCKVTEESERIGRDPGTMSELLPTTAKDVHMAEAVMSQPNMQLLHFRNTVSCFVRCGSHI